MRRIRPWLGATVNSAKQRKKPIEKIINLFKKRHHCYPPQIQLENPMSEPTKVKESAGEQWRLVSGYGNRYKVSDLGRVSVIHRGKEHIIFQCLVRGYPKVSLWLNKKRKAVSVHRLVA